MLSISREVQQAIAEQDVVPGAGFAARVAAIEHLETHVLDRLRYLQESVRLPEELKGLAGRAEALRRRLEAENELDLEKLRQKIKSGRYKPQELKRAFIRYAGPPGKAGEYDGMDSLVGGLLGLGIPPKERATPEPEMVAYQPTPARSILALIKGANLRPKDIFVDLGSGLGQVVILVALLSGASAWGIEFEPAYCEYAERCARRLKVPRVQFIRGDAREASLSGGTIFFLYTPFRGGLLRQVLERLRAEAKKRPIRVFTYGPCTAEVAGTGWLMPGDSRHFVGHEVAVFYAG
jgi:hypothetical protein